MSTNKIENYNFYMKAYYSEYNNYYYHIITLNKMPSGPLSNYVKLMSIKNASAKIPSLNQTSCNYVIDNKIVSKNSISRNINLNICTIDNLTDIYEYLINNNYLILEDNNNIINKINNQNNTNKFLFTVSYNKN